MVTSTLNLGWTGIFIYLIIVFSFQKLIKNNEFAFLHILMALMYALWLPLPFALNQILGFRVYQVGSLFGFVYFTNDRNYNDATSDC